MKTIKIKRNNALLLKTQLFHLHFNDITIKIKNDEERIIEIPEGLYKISFTTPQNKLIARKKKITLDENLEIIISSNHTILFAAPFLIISFLLKLEVLTILSIILFLGLAYLYGFKEFKVKYKKTSIK